MDIFPTPESQCCSHCLAEIKNAQEAHKWEKLCELYWSQGGAVAFRLSTADEFKYLEKYGYLVTHETDCNLLVKVQGVNYEDSESYYTTIFCIDFHNHHRGVA